MTTRSTRSPRRRTVVALAVVLAVLVAFTVRLVDIQVVNAQEHISDSMAKALGSGRTLYGTRGPIVDTSGQPLADSILLYDGVLDPKNIALYEETSKTKPEPGFPRTDADDNDTYVPWATAAAEIAAITGQKPEEITAIVDAAVADNPDTQFTYLKRGLTTEQYRALADKGFPYLSFDAHPARTYPDGAVAGNLVGFMGLDGVPLAGLEESEDACLATENGSLVYQTGKDGVIIPGTEREIPAVDGGTLTLTIDRDLQWFLLQLIAEQVQDLGAKAGTITVVEVKTGKVRAAAEYPTVDPNDPSAAAPEDRGSRIFIESFEPGSTFKALTAATLIDTGAQTPASTVYASSRESFDNGARVGDAFEHDEYHYTLTGALIDSSNVAVSKFTERIDPQVRYDYLRAFGIGEGSAISFNGQATGLVWPVADWDPQTYYNTAFGQGLTSTVPELSGAYQAIANDGLRVPLSLVESCTKPDGTVVKPGLPEPVQVIKPATAVTVQQMLANVASQSTLADIVAVPGYNVAQKTGTAEKVDPDTGAYKQGVYFTTMIGFAPAEDPQYVVTVTLDEPTQVTSSGANASAWQKAMTQVLKTFRVPPSTTQIPVLPKFG